MVEKITLRAAVAAAFAVIVLTTGSAAAAPGKTLQAFASDQEISELFKRWAEQHRRDAARRSYAPGSPMAAQELSVAGALSAPAAKMADAAESITNVQHAGVDEGGIVKRHCDHLVILRR